MSMVSEKQRWGWIEKNISLVNRERKNWWGVVTIKRRFSYGKTLSEAIDNAMNSRKYSDD